MYDPTTDLMWTLASHVETHQYVADLLVELAQDARDSGDAGAADLLIEQVRTHRVQAVTLGARLAAMVELYGALHLADRRG